MELTEKEEMLIQAMREMDEIPYNFLLWYIAGKEKSVEAEKRIHGKEVRNGSQKIEIARSYMRGM